MRENNRQLAALFRAMADLLAAQRANPYRVRAYRRAADVLLAIEDDVATIAQRRGLEDIEGVGKDLAGKIREFLETGTIRAYEELKTPLPPEVKDWSKLPGLSDSLVTYLYFRLGIRTLPDLEQLIRSHLLRTLPGFSGSEALLLDAIRQQNERMNPHTS
jgi:DNA polymerase (family 10)